MTQEVSVPKWVRTVAIPKIGPFMSIALIAITLSIVGIEIIFTRITVHSLSKKSRITSIALGAAILGFGIFTISNPEAT